MKKGKGDRSKSEGSSGLGSPTGEIRLRREGKRENRRAKVGEGYGEGYGMGRGVKGLERR